MGKMVKNPVDWKVKLVAEMRRDKKKTVILVILLVVAGVVAGRMLIGGGAPCEATATVVPGSAAVSPSGGDRVVPLGQPRQRGSAGDQGVQNLQNLDSDVSRDLFRPDLGLYVPLAATKSAAKAETTGKDERDEEEDRRERERVIAAQASVLSVQSTVVCNDPGRSVAIINGRVLRVGGMLDGFQVTRITSRSCWLSKGGVTVERTLEKNPQ